MRKRSSSNNNNNNGSTLIGADETRVGTWNSGGQRRWTRRDARTARRRAGRRVSINLFASRLVLTIKRGHCFRRQFTVNDTLSTREIYSKRLNTRLTLFDSSPSSFSPYPSSSSSPFLLSLVLPLFHPVLFTEYREFSPRSFIVIRVSSIKPCVSLSPSPSLSFSRFRVAPQPREGRDKNVDGCPRDEFERRVPWKFHGVIFPLRSTLPRSLSLSRTNATSWIKKLHGSLRLLHLLLVHCHY